MRDKKYYIALDDFERRVVVNCLNEMRNSLIANGKYTDAVDEILLKIIDAKQKKFKVILLRPPYMLLVISLCVNFLIIKKGFKILFPSIR